MMKWNTIKYLTKEGIKGLWKNRLMALASIGTIVLSLLILGMSYSIAENVEYMMHQLETQLGITAYISEGTTDERIAEIERAVKSIPNVIEVSYVSKEDALKNFAGEQENDALFYEFQDDNPLPASFDVKVNSVDQQEAVVSTMRNHPELQVESFKNETVIFSSISKSIQLISLIIIACLVVISLLLITNTIKLTVYVRRKEINIMKYIGATDAFIRVPFIIEGIAIGVIGCMIPMWVIQTGYEWANEFVVTAFGSFMGGMQLQPINQIMQGIVPIFIALGVGIGVVGSAIAIHKHLKV